MTSTDFPRNFELSCIRFDFTAVTDRRWRLLAKEYIFARLPPYIITNNQNLQKLTFWLITAKTS